MTNPLAGIKALDLSQVIAGPYGTGLLSYLGVETVKVEMLRGEQGRSLAGSWFGLNRGKRSLPLDLTKDEGREILYRLAADADIFVENFRPGVVDRMGIGYEAIKKLNPRVIYVSVSAFGETGPYVGRPGFDPLLQAMTGIERLHGGPGNPPVFLRIAINDYASGMMVAAAVTLALFNRERTGEGAHLHLSLLRAGLFINGEAFTRYAGRPETRLPDKGQNGFSALDRMYKAADAWLYLLVEDDEERWRKLTSLAAFAVPRADPRFATAALRAEHDAALAEVLEAIFETQDVEGWLGALQAAGVPAAPVLPDYDRRFFEDIHPIINGYLVTDSDPLRGRIEHNGNYIRFSDAETQLEGNAAPRLGQHTEEVLGEIGYDEAGIERLRANGVIL
jgi:crotonobetainyl-CoA:carnitine CoA-transferase CaiB-like acyl-CoA transferase